MDSRDSGGELGDFGVDTSGLSRRSPLLDSSHRPGDVRVMAVKPGVAKEERKLRTGDQMKVNHFLVLGN